MVLEVGKGEGEFRPIESEMNFVTKYNSGTMNIDFFRCHSGGHQHTYLEVHHFSVHKNVSHQNKEIGERLLSSHLVICPNTSPLTMDLL